MAVVTAERTIEQAFDVGQPLIVLQHFEPRLYVQVLPILEGPLPSIIALQPPPTDAEFFLLRSIEWTIFQDTTYNTALEQANVILRYFLGKLFTPLCYLSIPKTTKPIPPGTGRVQAAQTLLDVLPPELAGISEPEERATEYLHYRQFFVIWETVERVVDCQSQHVPGMNKDAKATWLDDYRVCLFSVNPEDVARC